MKLFKFLVLISFFLAFATTFVHAKDQEVVTDVYGNELRPGARYYMEVPIAPAIRNSAIGPDSPGCPNGNVVVDFNKRRPISITPVLKSHSTVILEDTYVTVRFNYSYPCRMLISLVWQVDPDYGYVTTGSSENLHTFKITKYEGEGGSNKYQLAACPVEVSSCEPVDYTVENGVNYLVARGVNNLLPIVFVPVRQPRIAYKLPSM